MLLPCTGPGPRELRDPDENQGEPGVGGAGATATGRLLSTATAAAPAAAVSTRGLPETGRGAGISSGKLSSRAHKDSGKPTWPRAFGYNELAVGGQSSHIPDPTQESLTVGKDGQGHSFLCLQGLALSPLG